MSKHPLFKILFVLCNLLSAREIFAYILPDVRIVWLLRKNYDIISNLARNRSFRFQEHQVFLTFRSPETKTLCGKKLCGRSRRRGVEIINDSHAPAPRIPALDFDR
jgi:hypothetical protein